MMTSYSLYPSPHTSMLRTLTVAPLAVLITFALLLSMYLLVKTDYDLIIEDKEPPRFIDVVLKTPPPLETLPPKLERPTEPTPPPVMPKHIVEVEQAGIPIIEIARVDIPPPTIAPGFDSGDQLMAFIKVAPSYPATAAARGIEGFADVMFDVTEIGTTENIRIVYAEPSSIFNRSVLQAIKRWKYKPKMVDGKAVKSYDLKERISFELEKN